MEGKYERKNKRTRQPNHFGAVGADPTGSLGIQVPLSPRSPRFRGRSWEDDTNPSGNNATGGGGGGGFGGVGHSVLYHIAIITKHPNTSENSSFKINIKGDRDQASISYAGKFSASDSTLSFAYQCQDVGDIIELSLVWSGWSRDYEAKQKLMLDKINIANGASFNWSFDIDDVLTPHKPMKVIRAGGQSKIGHKLHTAARQGRLRELARLVREKEYELINQADETGRSVLQVAIDCMQVEFVRCILTEPGFKRIVHIWPDFVLSANRPSEKAFNRTSLTQQHSSKYRISTSLHEACSLGNATADEMALLLLSHAMQQEKDGVLSVKAVLNIQDSKGWTCGHCCARYSRAALLNTFLKLDRTLVDVVDDSGCSMMILACQNDQPDKHTILTLLKFISLNWDQSSEDLPASLVHQHTGSSWFHLLAVKVDQELLELLFDADYVGKRVLTLRDKNGRTPLMCAILSGSVEATRFLRKKMHGMMYRAFESVDNQGFNCLHLAVIKGSFELLDLIAQIPNFVSSMMEAENAVGDTPLHVAMNHNNNSAIQWLISRGANVRKQNRDGVVAMDRLTGAQRELASSSITSLSELAVYNHMLDDTFDNPMSLHHPKDNHLSIEALAQSSKQLSVEARNFNSIRLYQEIRQISTQLDRRNPTVVTSSRLDQQHHRESCDCTIS